MGNKFTFILLILSYLCRYVCFQSSFAWMFALYALSAMRDLASIYFAMNECLFTKRLLSFIYHNVSVYKSSIRRFIYCYWRQQMNTKIQQTKMLVTCQRFGDLFLFGLVWPYSSNQKYIMKVGSKSLLLTCSSISFEPTYIVFFGLEERAKFFQRLS